MLHFPVSEVDDIAWKDGGREVRAEGHLYDIVRVERLADGSVLIAALRDDQEGQLLAELERNVRLRLGQDAKGKDL